MKQLFSILALCMMVIATSCNNVEEPPKEGVRPNMHQQVTRASEAEMLIFEDYAQFERITDELKKLDSDNQRSEWMKIHYPNFRSIYDLYSDAMEEMAEYDDLDEMGYNAFMEKYSSLYFPMQDEDYGFYIPISDMASAFLANTSGDVSIGGEIVNLIDIVDYATLVNLGRAYYTEDSPLAAAAMTSFQINNPTMNSVGPEYDSGWKEYGRRKVKLKARRRFKKYSPAYGFSGSISLLHLEFCFRKKTFLGWVNYKCKSTIVFRCNIPGLGWIVPQTYEHNSTSSHDSEMEYPIKITSDTSHFYFTFGAAPCEASINYNDISQTLKYNWTMAPIQCVTPRTASPYSIIPNY
ncbi:MAG: hypothetical protein K2G78_00375 [Muribaculaceae bacterium]|nr:hypothetical protein [Muribaculaceae bacterium]